MDRLISEQELLKHFDTREDWAVVQTIKAIPSAEPQTGHWIENAPEYQNIDPPYICSECGNMHLRKTNYCDQCGAKMVEEQERSE